MLRWAIPALMYITLIASGSMAFYKLFVLNSLAQYLSMSGAVLGVLACIFTLSRYRQYTQSHDLQSNFEKPSTFLAWCLRVTMVMLFLYSAILTLTSLCLFDALAVPPRLNSMVPFFMPTGVSIPQQSRLQARGVHKLLKRQQTPVQQPPPVQTGRRLSNSTNAIRPPRNATAVGARAVSADSGVVPGLVKQEVINILMIIQAISSLCSAIAVITLPNPLVRVGTEALSGNWPTLSKPRFAAANEPPPKQDDLQFHTLGGSPNVPAHVFIPQPAYAPTYQPPYQQDPPYQDTYQPPYQQDPPYQDPAYYPNAGAYHDVYHQQSYNSPRLMTPTHPYTGPGTYENGAYYEQQYNSAPPSPLVGNRDTIGTRQLYTDSHVGGDFDASTQYNDNRDTLKSRFTLRNFKPKQRSPLARTVEVTPGHAPVQVLDVEPNRAMMKTMYFSDDEDDETPVQVTDVEPTRAMAKTMIFSYDDD